MSKGKDDLAIPINLDKWKKELFKDRYKKFRGYVFDRFLFKFAFFLILAFFFFLAQSYDFELDYLKCEGADYYSFDSSTDYSSVTLKTNLCKNRFYKEISWKNHEYLPSGEYGVEPTEWIYKALGFLLLALLVAFFSNHMIHNIKRKLK